MPEECVLARRQKPSVAGVWMKSAFPFDKASGSSPCSGGIDHPCEPPADDHSQGKLGLNAKVVIVPANDDVANAEVVPALPFAVSADSRFATTEAGEPSPFCGVDRQSTLWYSFTPAEDVLLLADVAGTDFEAVIGIWTGEPFDLVLTACSRFLESTVAFPAVAGETYLFQIGGRTPFSVGSGTVIFSLEVTVPPANDNFADAAAVASLPFSVEASNITATAEPGEPLSGCLLGQAARTIWDTYTPASDTILVANTEGSAPAVPYLAVYQGGSLGELVEITCVRPSFAGNQISLEAAAGVTYYFQVGRESFGPGVFSAEAEEVVAPGQGSGSAQAARGPASAGLPRRNVVFNLDAVDRPSCAPATFAVADPAGDTLGMAAIQHDVVAVSGGSDGENFCLTVTFAGPIELPGFGSRAVFGVFSFETDDNPQTGSLPGGYFNCVPPHDIRADIQLIAFRGGPLVPFLGAISPSQAFLHVEERSLELIIPLDELRGDDSFDLTMYFATFDEVTDCVPNLGFIRSPLPVAPGDANCDDAIDAVIVLQFTAGLLDVVRCDFVADVNHDGVVNALDAALILQASAGLLDGL